MSDLYTVIPGLQPSAQDLLEAELLAVQILQAQYPTLELREGTGLRDLVVRPTATILALVKLGTDYLFAQNTIANVDNTTQTDFVDALLSNWFLSRNLGTYSVISARLFFARQKNISINTDVYFSPDNTLKYFPSSPISLSASAMSYDSYSNEYYVDVQLTADTQGSQYDLSTGSLLYFSNFDPYFLHAEINFLVSSSIPSETNTEFIARAESAISTRNLINNPSIQYNIQSTFNYVRQLVTIGYGDPEMVRDQINAIFDPQSPVTISALTSVGTLNTVTLINHGYNSGQLINVAGATPTGYNGQYYINVLDTNTFTFTTAIAEGGASVLPTVNAVNNPIQIHDGGKVDIYCSSALATSIVQLTLDKNGMANLSGPVYSLSRSSISGGTSADTVPLNNTASVTGINVVSTTATAMTSAPHAFKVGDNVTVSGATQSQTISSITCSGLTVTVTVTGHDFLVGNSVVIAGVTPVGYNGTFTITSVATNTFTYNVLTNIATSGTGGTAQVNLVNGTFPIVSITSTSFSYLILQVTNVAVSGTITASTPIDFTVTDTNKQSKIINNITCTGTVATVTLTNHGYTNNRFVTITNAIPTSYNGTWLITSVPNNDQFTFNVPSNISTPFSVGTAWFVIPNQDFGFSESQNLLLNFGANNANGTVSISIEYIQNLDSIQAYLTNVANRVVCADYLARGFNFYLLNVTLDSYDTVAPNSALASNVITSYLTQLSPGASFIMSDMITTLRLNGIINIVNPPTVTFQRYTRDLNPPVTGTITTILEPNDVTNVFILNSITTGVVNTPTGSSLIS
jgi:hypothetical protein